MNRQKKKSDWLHSLLIAGIALVSLWSGCQPAREDPARLDVDETADRDYGEESALLNNAFRIDISEIKLTLTYHPDAATVDGNSRIRFTMRPGQKRPLVHFNPAARGQVLQYLQLDDRVWSNPADGILVRQFEGSTQQAIEIQQDVDENSEHLLIIGYRLHFPASYPMFITQVNDIQGIGNEEIFPTINAPHEMIDHLITLQVDSATLYRCIGSGLVKKTANSAIQEWTLDSERQVASYTIMFALAPEADTLYQERMLANIPVRVIAFAGGASIAAAFTELDSWLPQLLAEIAPFPMPRGLSIFLTNSGGGMEYYGGTITSLSALSHEVFHMYFGCSAIARTYRDSWWDEAITSWYSRSYPAYLIPINEDFQSNIVSGRSPVAIGFDTRAYYQGSQIMETLAQRLGGREAMTRFLSQVYRAHAWEPFTTMDLAGYFRDYSGIDIRDDFRSWFYRGSATAAGTVSLPIPEEKKVDLTPPETVLEKYRSPGEKTVRQRRDANEN
jgi:aminopeptidase N